jgi:hypothetical protein
MNDDDTLLGRINNWTQTVLRKQEHLNAYIEATQSTNNAQKEALIDDLLGESKAGKSGQVLTGKSGTVTWEWEDVSSDWQDAHYRSKY